MPNKDSKDTLRAQLTAKTEESEGPKEHIKESAEERARKPYQFLMINILREYLALEMNVQAPFPIDSERIFDDFGKPRSCGLHCVVGNHH